MDKQFTPGPLADEAKQERAEKATWFDKRAMWLRAAASAAANEALETLPASGAFAYGALALGAGPALAIPYLAGTMAKSEDEDVAAVGQAIEKPIVRAKGEQQQFNEEQLDKPIVTRVVEGAANVVKGPMFLAGGALGVGPLAEQAKAAEVGAGLIRGPFGYYTSLADPEMAGETVAADPFGALVEVAPAAKGTAGLLRSHAHSVASKGGKVAKAAKGLDVLAEILDPRPENAHTVGEKPQATTKRSPGSKKAAVEARAVGVEPNVVDYGQAQAEKPVKTRPTVDDGQDLPSVASPKALAVAGGVGRALRGAMWGSVVLEPVTALTGLPLLGATAGALANPAFKAAVRAVAKKKGIRPSEVQAALDQAFNDPNAVGRPDLRESVDTVMQARKTGNAVQAYANAIGSIIEQGATPTDPRIPGTRAVPEPARIGVKMSLLPDGSIAYDPSGVPMWFKHAADSADAAVKSRVLEIIAKEAKSEANSVKWGVATPQEREAIATALERRRALDAATAANEKLLDRRSRLENKLDELREEVGVHEIQNGLAEYRQHRKALVEFEKAAVEFGASEAARAAVNEFRRLRRQHERGMLTGTARIEKMQDWFNKVIKEVGPSVSPVLVEKARAAAARLDDFDANPKLRQWTRLVDLQKEHGLTLDSIKLQAGSYTVSWPGLQGQRKTTYKSVSTLVTALEKTQREAQEILAAVDRGEAVTPQQQVTLDKSQALRSAIDEHALDFMMVRRERGKVASALDTISAHFGGSPGQIKRALAIELQAVRKEAQNAIRAEMRIEAAVNKLSREQGLNADVVLREQQRFEEARAVAVAKNANIEALTAMLDSVDELFKRQLQKDITPEQKKARALVRSDVELEQKLSVGEALAINLENEIAGLIDTSGEVKAAFDAAVAAQEVETLRRNAKKKRRDRYPDDEKKAMVRAKLADYQKPFSIVSLEWTDLALQEMVEKVSALASEWAPFGAPIDPIMVRRMFSMAAMDNGLVHLINKRAVGALAEAVATGLEAPNRKLVAEIKTNLSKTIAQAVADSIKTGEWIDPVLRLPNGQTPQMSTVVSSWMQTLSGKEKRAFQASTAKSLGTWLSKQIQSHHMQGAVASDLASQMIAGDTVGRATPNVSFVSWAIGESDKMVAPFNLAQLRQMLAGGPQAVESFLRESMRYVPTDIAPSDLLKQRLTPEGVVAWIQSLDNYVPVVGSDVRAAVSKGGRAAPAIGGALGALGGALLGGSDPMTRAAGAAVGGAVGTVMAPQILSASAPSFNNLRVFLQQVGGDLATQGYAPLEHAYVHRGVAAALDAQVSYIKNVSRIESLMKIMLVAFSLPTTIMNVMSNDFLESLTAGQLSGELVGKQMPMAGKELAAWREGKLNPRDEAKWTAFAGTGLMESSVLGDVVRDWGTGQAAGLIASRFDDTLRVVTTFYAMQDGLAKAASYSKQYDLLDRALITLSPGKSLWVDQGSGRYKKVTKVGDVINVEERGQLKPVYYDEQAYADLVGSGAAVGAAAKFFDFSSMPNLLRKHDGSMLSAYAAPLFGWAYKAVDAPGKSGLLATVLNGAPSTNYLTNDPLLLREKAAEFAMLTVKRSVILSIDRAESRAAEQNPTVAKLLSFGIPLIPWVAESEDPSVLNFGDMSSALPFAPTLTLMSLGVQGVMGLADILGYGPESKQEIDNASLVGSELTKSQREQAKWDRFWFNYYSGKGGSTRDLARVLGISGNFLFPLMVAMQNQSLQSSQLKDTATKTLRMVLPKTPVDIADVIVGIMMPELGLSSRKIVQTSEGARFEDAFLWTAKKMTGIGVAELGLDEANKRLGYVAQRTVKSMTKGLQDRNKEIESLLQMPQITAEKKQALSAEYEENEYLLSMRDEWLNIITQGGGMFESTENWL